MFDSIRISPELDVNLKNRKRTHELLTDAVVECLRQDFGGDEDSFTHIDDDRLHRRLTKVVRAVISKTNPRNRLRPTVSISWNVNEGCFFQGRLFIDVDDRRFQRSLSNLLPANEGLSLIQ